MTEKGDVIIKLDDVNLYYDRGKPNEVHALNDISIEINRGEYAAFFGPSGCGKTTLLYAISGIDKVHGGHIYINNRDIAGLSNQELAIFRQTGIGIVFQQFNLVPSLTVLQNVALPMSFVGVNREKAEKEGFYLLQRLQMDKYANRYPHELSGGQQQRVGIARALANNPPIIIADEPLGNLDSVNAKNVLEFLKELHQKDGRTIIMVTHEAWSLRDVEKVFHMKDGVVTNVEMRDPSKNKQDVGKGEEQPGVSQEESMEITARIVSNFLMRGYSYQEIKRFEDALKDRFMGKMGAMDFRLFIDKPFVDGGVGLWSSRAERVSSYIENVIEKRKDVNAMLEVIEKHPELPLKEEVRRIREWITADYKGKLSHFQVVAMDEMIADRLRHFISDEQFRNLLDKPIKDFGVGLSFRTVQKISERMEMVLTGANEYHPVR